MLCSPNFISPSQKKKKTKSFLVNWLRKGAHLYSLYLRHISFCLFILTFSRILLHPVIFSEMLMLKSQKSGQHHQVPRLSESLWSSLRRLFILMEIEPQLSAFQELFALGPFRQRGDSVCQRKRQPHWTIVIFCKRTGSQGNRQEGVLKLPPD